MIHHFMNSAKEAINTLGSKALGVAVKEVVGSKLEPYGKINHLEMNLKERRLSMELVLKGEQEPLVVKAEGFGLEKKDETLFAYVDVVVTSREWINQLCQRHIQGKRFPVPQQYGALLSPLIDG